VREGGRFVARTIRGNMYEGVPYQIDVTVRAPTFEAAEQVRLACLEASFTAGCDNQWSVQLITEEALLADKDPRSTGVAPDFTFVDNSSHSVGALQRSPETVIEVEIWLNSVGRGLTNELAVYAPEGFRFMSDCLAPGFDSPYFGSCRERYRKFGSIIYSGALVNLGEGGLSPEDVPVMVKLSVLTPPVTPKRNDWYFLLSLRGVDTAWGRVLNPVTILHMDAIASYAPLKNSIVDITITFTVFYPVPPRGYVRVTAPPGYNLTCDGFRKGSLPGIFGGDRGERVTCATEDATIPPGAVNQMLVQLDVPGETVAMPLDIMEADGILPPASGDVVLYGPWALNRGRYSFAFSGRTPPDTPAVEDNVWRIFLLDSEKRNVDGSNQVTAEVLSSTVAISSFQLSWSLASPGSMVDLGLTFRIELPILPELRVAIIQIDYPDGFQQGVRKPSDVILHTSRMPVEKWSWIADQASLWLHIRPNATIPNGTFAVSFAAITPSRTVGMPVPNQFVVSLCEDFPWCEYPVLQAPVAGFGYGTTGQGGEIPEETMNQAAQGGNAAVGAAAWSVLALLAAGFVLL